MVRIEVYSSVDEALARLKEIMENIRDELGRINTKLEYMESIKMTSVSGGVVKMLELNIVNPDNVSVHKVYLDGSIMDVDYRLLDEARRYYLGIMRIVNSFTQLLSKLRINGRFAVVYMGYVPIMIVRNVDENLLKAVSPSVS